MDVYTQDMLQRFRGITADVDFHLLFRELYQQRSDVVSCVLLCVLQDAETIPCLREHRERLTLLWKYLCLVYANDMYIHSGLAVTALTRVVTLHMPKNTLSQACGLTQIRDMQARFPVMYEGLQPFCDLKALNVTQVQTFLQKTLSQPLYDDEAIRTFFRRIRTMRLDTVFAICMSVCSEGNFYIRSVEWLCAIVHLASAIYIQKLSDGEYNVHYRAVAKQEMNKLLENCKQHAVRETQRRALHLASLGLRSTPHTEQLFAIYLFSVD